MSSDVRHPRADGDGPPAGARPPEGRAGTRLERLLSVRPEEFAAVGWSWLFFFSVLTAYYVIRPIRDDMGVAGGVQNLPWLFMGTLLGMAAAHPAFGVVATRMPRRLAVAAGYRFFAVNLVIFFVALSLVSEAGTVWTGRIFFVWTAVFNMFAVSLFWSVMTDAFSTAQGKRLFGFIGAGGTIGGITGSVITTTLVGVAGAAGLLLVSAALLEVASFAARRVLSGAARQSAHDEAAPRSQADAAPLGGRAWDGLKRTGTDPYLRGIAIHLMLFTVLTTFLYFQQATIVDAAITDRVARTRFFASIDLTVNVITLLVQTLATGHLIRTFGLTSTLSFLPALSVAGFLTLGAAPSIGVLLVFQVLRRASEFAVARPAREVLFTATERRDRYKAKNFIDTFVYRAGDQIGASLYAALLAIGVGLSGVSAVAAALSAAAVGVAIWLGRRQRQKETGNGKQGAGLPQASGWQASVGTHAWRGGASDETPARPDQTSSNQT